VNDRYQRYLAVGARSGFLDARNQP